MAEELSTCTMMRLAASIWLAVIVYNLISAVLGINHMRRFYVKFLRSLSFLTSSKGPSQATSKAQGTSSILSSISGQEPTATLLRTSSFSTFKHEFQLEDALGFIRDGVGVIVDDIVTKRFSTSDVEKWNFLSRTQMQVNLGLKMEFLLWASILFRFGVFFLIRLPIGLASMMWLLTTVSIFSVLSLFPKTMWKFRAERYCSMVCSRLIAASFSAVITVHNKENRAKSGSVCVANHTTPIDIVMLAEDNCFTLVGQRHGGFTGLIQRVCSLAQSHIWFERRVADDRIMVSKRLKEEIAKVYNHPILIFPEGTCINNTSVFMFKKGCFELGATIYPVVIKYRREFADPFWNSQEQNMLTYIFMLMTSWAIVCDIYYLKPTSIRPKETAIEFAQRVKANICSNGGLVDLPWDGMIKRPGNERYLLRMVEEERKAYSEALEITHQPSSPTETESQTEADSECETD